jgi:formiminotetrahydrofolate cyclodeaminase
MYDQQTSIAKFLDAAAARQPTPGGGSVAALVGALAVSMGEMVLNYSLGKKSLEPFAGQFKPAVAELTKARALMLQLMAEDQLAYEALTEARKMPADALDRQARVNAALVACIRVPQAIAATALAVLEQCDQLVGMVNYYLLSDMAVCSDLAMAVIRCAIYNVRVNLKDLDEEDRRSVEAAVGQILARAVSLIKSVAPRIWARYDQGA